MLTLNRTSCLYVDYKQVHSTIISRLFFPVNFSIATFKKIAIPKNPNRFQSTSNPTCFKSENFDLNDKGRSGRPIEASGSLLEELVEEDPRQSTRDLAIQLNFSFNTVLNRF